MQALEARGHIDDDYTIYHDDHGDLKECRLDFKRFRFAFDLKTKLFTISASQGTPQEQLLRFTALNYPSSTQGLLVRNGKVVLEPMLVSASQTFEYVIGSILENKSLFDYSVPAVGEKVYNSDGVCTGVYLGCEMLEDEQNNLRGIFDLYAAPTHLADKNDSVIKEYYYDIVSSLSQKRNWYGYNGTHCSDEKDLKREFLNNSYQGGWFIPTKTMLEQYIFDNEDQNILQNILMNRDAWHWSCTKNNEGHIFNIRAEEIDYDKSDVYELAVLPFRAVRRPM